MFLDLNIVFTPNFLDQKLFWTKDCFGPMNVLDPKFLGTKHMFYLTQQFFGFKFFLYLNSFWPLNVLDPTFFGPLIFLDQHFFCPNFLDPKLLKRFELNIFFSDPKVFGPKFFISKMFLCQISFNPFSSKICLDPQFSTKTFLDRIYFWTKTLLDWNFFFKNLFDQNFIGPKKFLDEMWELVFP